MKALLICPAERPGVAELREDGPLALLALFGKPLIAYWLERLAVLGAKEVLVLAADRPEQVRNFTADGARWGLRVEVIPERSELTVGEARSKYRGPAAGWLRAPNDVCLADCFPGASGAGLFSSYAGFFNGLVEFLPEAQCGPRIGLRQVRPGIWAGMRARISPRARLIAPCWIGDYASVEAEAVVGPDAIVESGSVIDANAIVERSFIGPATLVGPLTEVRSSLVSGNRLIDWRSNSSVTVPDPFLLCRLNGRRLRKRNLAGRSIAMTALLLSSPAMLLFALRQKLCGNPVLRTRQSAFEEDGVERNVRFYEFCCEGWWRRWPRLWSIVQGEFAWVGNPPLPPAIAGRRNNDFERLWIAGRPGLVSLLDAQGCRDVLSEEAKAHAAFYSVAANWRLDARIIFQSFIRMCKDGTTGLRDCGLRDYGATGLRDGL